MTTTPDLNEWTGRNGQTRRYVNNWTSIIGLDITYYKTGNIRHATWDGEAISNTSANALLGTKVWLDSDDTVHVDRHPGRPGDKNGLTAELIRERVTAAVNA